MSSIKCPDCGLVNFATALSCKRCQRSFEAASEVAAPTDTMPHMEPVPVVKENGPVAQPSPGTRDVQAAPEVRFQSAVRRDGELQVMTEESVLPDRCVRCNAPTERQLKRIFHSHPDYINFVAIVSLLIALVLLIFKRKGMTIHIGLCDRHFNRRLVGMFFGAGLVGLGLLMGIVTAFNGDYWLLGCGAGSLISGAFFIVLLTPTVSAERIEEPFIWLKGAHQDFLDTLPVN